MKKVIGSKKALIIAAVAFLIVILVSMALLLSRGAHNNTYRSIKIVELGGDVNIDREGVSGINASVNMNLVSGDRLTTGQDAYVVLCLDTDKYVMLGEQGAMKVNAEGSETASKTSVELEAGSVLSEIQNPLGKDSTYDIVTPNATMSVRGTVFEVDKSADGNISVLVYDGCVAVAPEGLVPTEYAAGEYTVFTDSNPAVSVTERAVITEDCIKGPVLERLNKIVQDGRNLNLGEVLSSVTNEQENGNEQVLKDDKENADAPDVKQPAQNTSEKTDNTIDNKNDNKTGIQTNKKTNTVTSKNNEAEEPSPEPDITQPDNSGSGSGSSSGSHKKKKTKPSEESSTESSKENPTEPSKENPTEPSKENPTEPSKENPTEPSREDPTESSEQDESKYKVMFKLAYIALWSEDTSGQKYSTIMDIEPYNGGENPDVKSGSKIDKPSDVEVSSTPEGWIAEKSGLKHIGWCTIDGRQWDFDKDVVTGDVTLYPIWQDSKGRKYYPYIHSAGGKTYPCNSIIEGSTPET